MEHVPGGYILLARKTIESEIWKKPPEWFKIWSYLLIKAQHVPYKELKRGQLITSIPEIQDSTKWMAGNRPCKISKATVFNCLEWLRRLSGDCSGDEMKKPMITTAKTTHHMLVTISNYEVYQTSSIYENNGEDKSGNVAKETRRQRRGDNINKNGIKNDKNENIYTANFELFWAAYPEAGYQNSKPQAAKNFATLLKKGSKAEDLIQAAKNYAADCKVKKITDFFYKAQIGSVN